MTISIKEKSHFFEKNVIFNFKPIFKHRFIIYI